MNPTTTTKPDETSELITHYLQLKDQADAALEQMNIIKERLAALHPDGTEHDGHKVTISRGSRINEKRLMDAFPAHDHPELYAVKPVTAKVRAKISPEQLEPFLDYNKPSIKVS